MSSEHKRCHHHSHVYSECEDDQTNGCAHLVFSVMSTVADSAYAVSEIKEPGIFLAFDGSFMPMISSKPFSSRDDTGIRVGHTDSAKGWGHYCHGPEEVASANFPAKSD